MIWKRPSLPFAILLSLLAALPLAAAAGAQAPRRTRVAIIDFDYAQVRSATSAFFGTSVDVGKGISDLLTADLAKNGTFSVIDRDTVETMMTDQDFSDSDRADAASAAKLGKLLRVDAVIIGAMTQFGSQNPNNDAGVAPADSAVQVQLHARVVNVETGQIQGVADGAGESSSAPNSSLGSSSGWQGWGSNRVDFASSDFQHTLVGEAIQAAVDRLSGNLVADASRAVHKTAKLEGVIAAVDSGQIILNVGSDAGVKAEDLLEIFRVTKEIRDPSTGEVIRRLTTTVGVIKATDVDEKSSVCAIVSGSGFQVGDRVRAAAAPPAPATPAPPAAAAPASPASTAPTSPAPPAAAPPASPAPAAPPAAAAPVPPAAATPAPPAATIPAAPPDQSTPQSKPTP